MLPNIVVGQSLVAFHRWVEVEDCDAVKQMSFHALSTCGWSPVKKQPLQVDQPCVSFQIFVTSAEGEESSCTDYAAQPQALRL